MRKTIHFKSIYLIRIGSVSYVGSSLRTKDRKFRHQATLKSGTHHNTGLQNAYNVHQTFNFYILEHGDSLTRENIISREQYWYDNLKFKYKLVNSSRFVACPRYGIKPTPAKDKDTWRKNLKKTMSDGRMKGKKNPFWGRKHTPETIAHFSQIKGGKVKSEETRSKMSAAHRGKKRPSEVVARTVMSRKSKGSYHQKGDFVGTCQETGKIMFRFSNIKEIQGAGLSKSLVYAAIKSTKLYKNAKWHKEMNQ